MEDERHILVPAEASQAAAACWWRCKGFGYWCEVEGSLAGDAVVLPERVGLRGSHFPSLRALGDWAGPADELVKGQMRGYSAS